jgi:dihydropteroate synthase
MGVLNLTPDSFYDGNPTRDMDRILSKTGQMLEQGATMIDIGAHSTRPGAHPISEAEELQRLCLPVQTIRETWPEAILSVDTYRSGIARKMVQDHGVDMINDISGGDMDPLMFETARDLQVPYIFMHMQGTPLDMQQDPVYGEVVRDVLNNLSEKLKRLNELGVNDVIADPGFGFGKTLDHNYTLLSRLDAFLMLGVPVLVGLSRKSMVYKLLGCGPGEALNGSTVLHVVALLKGASILRVHDVAEAVEVVKLVEKLQEVEN